LFLACPLGDELVAKVREGELEARFRWGPMEQINDALERRLRPCANVAQVP
jgi:hypothetical protein